ncbi:serine/threonine-protein kinase [Herbiconiux liukaitaii]|uniref:serine/threonine-protein kinase n=1 Tax=Herbiconiux liukaitaii TaxID=3342799 RepID=UPI0035B8A9B1
MRPESSPDTGELLDGRYQLESRIGAGGMGVVYRARDETLGRTVAVKLFRDSAADAARTTSETRLLAGLNHPALVTLYDAQVAPVDPARPSYLVMEFVDGPTLTERVAGGPLDPADVATMARDLAEALHVVHQAGIVHRDIKPSNVLLRSSHVPGEEYRAKLADFGIAHLIDSTRLTTPGTLIGTAAYLSPEQVRGSDPAPASDIYALGLVLMEALTAKRAFPQAGTHEAALARLTSDPLVPAEFGYGWRSLLTAMTAREPSERPSALDVVLAAGRLAAPEEATGALDPDATEAAEVLAPEASAPEATKVMPRSTTQATEAFAPARTQATEAFAPARTQATEAFAPAFPQTTEALHAPTTTPLLPQASEHEAPARSRSRVQRWQIIVLVVALVVVAAVVGILLWQLGASSDPSNTPTLPALDDPLGTHMQELLDSVQR